MDIKEFISLLNEKRRVVLIIIAIGIFAGIVADFVFPSYYETNVTFMVLESKMIRRNLEGKKLDIDTYLNFVNNDSVYYYAYQKLDIQKRFNMDFDRFKKCIDVLSVEDTAIITLTVIFPDKKMSYEIAKTIASRVIELNRNIIQMEIKSGYRFAEKQVELAEKQYRDARKDLSDFIEKNHVFLNAEEVELARDTLAVFSNGYNLPYTSSEFSLLYNRSFFAANNINTEEKKTESLFDIDGKIIELKAHLKTAVYDNQKIKIKKEIAFYETLKEEKLKRLEKIKQKLSDLEKDYNKNKFSFLEKYNRFIAISKAYEKLLTDVMSIKIEIAGKTKEMALLGEPVPPQKPVFPRLSITLPSGLFLSILIAFLYILLLGFYRKINA